MWSFNLRSLTLPIAVVFVCLALNCCSPFLVQATGSANNTNAVGNEQQTQTRHLLSGVQTQNQSPDESSELEHFLSRLSNGRRRAEQLMSEIWLNKATLNTCIGCKLLVKHARNVASQSEHDLHQLIVSLCRVTRIDVVDPNEFCNGLADRFAPPITQILTLSKLHEQQICAQLLHSCALKGQYLLKPLFWQITIPKKQPIDKPYAYSASDYGQQSDYLYNNYSSSSSYGYNSNSKYTSSYGHKGPDRFEGGRFLHLSDAHLDAYYREGALAHCGRVHCCNVRPDLSKVYEPEVNEQMDPSTAYFRRHVRTLSNQIEVDVNRFDLDLETEKPTLAGYWGSFGNCDLPIYTFAHMLRSVAKDKLKDIDYIVYTGDTVASNIWSITDRQVKSSLYTLTKLIKKYLIDSVGTPPIQRPSTPGYTPIGPNPYQAPRPTASAYGPSPSMSSARPYQFGPPVSSSSPYSPSRYSNPSLQSSASYQPNEYKPKLNPNYPGRDSEPVYRRPKRSHVPPQLFPPSHTRPVPPPAAPYGPSYASPSNYNKNSYGNSNNNYYKPTSGFAKRFIPVIGNHDTVAVNLFGPNWVNATFSAVPLYEELYELWKEFIPVDQFDSFRQGGYYSVLLGRNLRLIVLNTQHCFRLNLWNVLDVKDPGGQLQWLADQLAEAEQLDQQVHLLGHIAPDRRSCTSVWLHNFLRLVGRFENTIKAQFYGHNHLDEIRLYWSKTSAPKTVNKAVLPLEFLHANSPHETSLHDLITPDHLKLVPRNVDDQPQSDSAKSSQDTKTINESSENQAKQPEENVDSNESTFRTHSLDKSKLSEIKQNLIELKSHARVCSIAFLAPSLTPNGDVNPAYKIYSVDDTGFVVNAETYYADLDAANHRHSLNNRGHYSYRTYSPDSNLPRVLSNIQQDEPAIETYSKDAYNGGQPQSWKWIPRSVNWKPKPTYGPRPPVSKPYNPLLNKFKAEQRDKELRWQFLYDFKGAYGTARQSWIEWAPIVEKLKTDNQLFQAFYNRLHRNSNGARWQANCNSQCANNLISSLQVHDPLDLIQN